MADDSVTLARAVPLRSVTPVVVSGTDAATLQTALETFFQSGGDNSNLIGMVRVADYKVLILYAA